MNRENDGRCNTRNLKDPGEYGVPKDDEGKNPLTGSSIFIPDGGSRRFTCKEIEVFAL